MLTADTFLQKCGHELYADLSSRSPREVNRLASMLQCTDHPAINTQESYGMKLLPRTPSPSSQPKYIDKPSPSSSSTSSSLLNKSNTGSTSSTLVGSGSSPGPINPHQPQVQSYLELCISTGQYTKTLSEIDLTNISCDGELFQRIRSEYFRLRKFRFYLWLLKPSGIHFVKASPYIHPGKYFK